MSRFYGGIGAILVFHRLVRPQRGQRLANTSCETSPEFFDALVEWVRSRGDEIISIDEACDRLLHKRASRRRFIVLTFDDGYRDTYDVAYRRCASLGVPMTLYLATGLLDRTLPVWWYLFEDACARRARLQVPIDGVWRQLSLRTLPEKRAAYEELWSYFRRVSADEARAVCEEVFGAATVRAHTDALIIGWDEAREMNGSGLVTLGAHTRTHPVLSQLAPEQALEELVASRRRLEEEIGRPVLHFAFPFGSRVEVGSREVALAREAGFRSAVTTRLGHLFPAHAEHMQALPRIPVPLPTCDDAEALMSGLRPALRSRGRRVVTL